MDKAAALRQLLAMDDLLVVPGIHDPLGARIVEELGFSAAYVGGFATGSQLVHSEPVLSVTDQMDAAARIDKVIDIPLIVDAHAGWGDAIHAIRTVRELEHAGVAGFHMEDQIVPKRASYFRNVMHILPRDEFIQKFRCAVEARRNPNTVVIGRTDAFSSLEGSKDYRRNEAIERSRALIDAGADLVFLRGVTSIEDCEYFRTAMPEVPQMTITHGDIPVATYRDLGFKMLVYPTASVIVAYEAIKKLYASVRDAGEASYTPQGYWDVRTQIFTTIGMEELWRIEKATVEDGEPEEPFVPELVND
jgi:methylisocitrate lyase